MNLPKITTAEFFKDSRITISDAPVITITNELPEEEESGSGSSGSGGSGGGGAPDPVMPDDLDPDIRPWDDNEGARIFALLVGINAYPAPNQLGGCLKDISNIENYLISQYGAEEGRLQIMKLTDKEATYDNIIAAFRSHLREAGPHDAVWFHFSGHGTESFTANEFLTIEPNGKDQNMVCYQDKEIGSQLLLADKELAVLLHEVATLDTLGQPKETPHIVVSMDCCHSGSLSRDFEEDPNLKTRNISLSLTNTRKEAEANGEIRSIDTYLEGYFVGNDRMSLPVSKHVLLSACESVQKAGDLPTGGVFSSGLIDALDDAQGNLNYSDLFVKARATTRRIRMAQTPQFETIGNFNPYTRFLDGKALGTPDRYEVEFSNGNWLVNCGAIHGLPISPKEPIELEIQTAAPENKPIAAAEIDAVGAQKSSFTLKDDITLDPDTMYQAVLRLLPAPPVTVWIHGDSAAIEALKKAWDKSKNILYAEGESKPEGATLEVIAENGKYIVRDLLTDKVATTQIIETDPNQEDTAKDIVVDALGKMVRWRRIVALENPKSKLKPMASVEMEVYTNDIDPTIYKGPEIKLYASKENFVLDDGNILLAGFVPKVILENVKQDLYCYYYQLNSNYGIESHEGEVVYRADEFADKRRVELPMLKEIMGWGLRPIDNEATAYFKILITTEPMDYHQLLQDPVGLRSGITRRWRPSRVRDDWYAITIKATIVRKDGKLKADAETSLADGQLKIRPHAGVTGEVSLSQAAGGDRSYDPANKFALFDKPEFQMINIQSNRDEGAKNVLEINNINVANPEGLRDHPLEIEMATSLGEDEYILPLAFDGANFVVIGDSASEGDKTVINIREIPKVETSLNEDGSKVEDPFGSGEPQDRSLFSALKMAFFKIVLGKNPNKLRWVDYSNPAKPERKTEGLKEKVAAATDILLLVHGLIGDTKNMIGCMATARDDTGKSILDRCDLILTFDYENLNTPINEIAIKLKHELLEVGINRNDNKKLTVFGNSMGGLVSRWFIEREDGNEVVDHLILTGTPSNGSNFGRLESAREFAASALNLGLNFLPAIIAPAGMLAKTLQAADQITVSLEQMIPGSPFLEKLNASPDPGIPYTIVAGNATKYTSPHKGFKKLFEKVAIGLGSKLYGSKVHDIAVAMDSILSEDIWKNRGQKAEFHTLVCHHLNYYSHEPSVEVLGKLEM